MLLTTGEPDFIDRLGLGDRKHLGGRSSAIRHPQKDRATGLCIEWQSGQGLSKVKLTGIVQGRLNRQSPRAQAKLGEATTQQGGVVTGIEVQVDGRRVEGLGWAVGINARL